MPGPGAGDNLSFLWNFWWMRESLATSRPFFEGAPLFAPSGVDLTLHTHTALPAFVGATLLGSLSPPGALNITIIVSIFLAAICTYALAWQHTTDRYASVLAGLIFAGSPFLTARLNGHFNLTNAWVIPLFAMLAWEARGAACGMLDASIGRGRLQPARRRAVWWGSCLGVLMGLTVYIDYYYVVYQAVVFATFLLADVRAWSLSRHQRPSTPGVIERTVGVLILLVASLLAALVVSGGFEFSIGDLRVSVRGAYNPLQILWVLVAVWLYLHFRPRLVAARNPHFDRRAAITTIAAAAVAFSVVAAPLLLRAMRLAARGEYVTHQYTWRSGPDGIDASTLFMGSPFHPIWGDNVRRAQESRHINVMESSAWLGAAVLVLAGWALRHNWHDRTVRRWTLLGAVFFVWSLGPHLTILGANTGLALPTAVLRYLPILSNVRIPGRAIVVVYLVLALLSAVALARWRRRSTRAWVPAIAIVLVVLDFAAAPIPMTALDASPLDDVLRQRPERGALCELPLGMRDGFGERGNLDERALFRQTIHRRPLVGGFVARLPPSVVSAYQSDPLLAGLLHLSSGSATRGDTRLPDRQTALDLLRKHDIAFVTLNRTTAHPDLTRYVSEILPLSLLAEDDERSLYIVLR